MKFRSIVLLLLSVVLLISLCACNSGDDSKTDATTTVAGAAVTTTAEETTTQADATTTTKADAVTTTEADAVTTTEPDAVTTTEEEPVIITEPTTEDPAANLVEPSKDSANVYLLKTADDLKWFMLKGPLDGNYSLEANITFNDPSTYNTWSSLENKPANVWTPVGSDTTPFTGSFNGNGNRIDGLYISGGAGTGFFGYIQGAVISNLVIGNGYIRSTDNGCGAIAGYYLNPIIDGRLNNISGCVNYATVDGYAQVGGIVGYYYPAAPGMQSIKIENCVNHGNVSALKEAHALYAGGIAGACIGMEINSCANFGTVSGGIIGNSVYDEKGCAIIGGIAGVIGSNSTSDSIKNCYNKGDVYSANKGGNSGTAGVGGIVGRMNGSNETCKIDTCYNVGNVYTNSVDAVQVSATCATKSGADYVKNIYNAGKALLWQTETPLTNNYSPTCGYGTLASGVGAVTIMGLDSTVWCDSTSYPILWGIAAEHQTSAQ